MFKVGDYIKLIDWKKIGIIINEDNTNYLVVDNNAEVYFIPKIERVFVKKSSLEEYNNFIKNRVLVTDI